MKGLKNFTLFFMYPVVLIVIGFVGGVTCIKFFYPGTFQVVEEKSDAQGVSDAEEQGSDLYTDWQVITGTPDNAEGVYYGENQVSGQVSDQASGQVAVVLDQASDRVTGQVTDQTVNQADFMQPGSEEDKLQEVSILSQKLNAGTSYVLEETDLRNDTVVETTWKLPAKYIGMNKEQFLEAMELYEASPPLEELERGFVSLEVLAFSPQKVVVQMNYDYVQPGSSFYLMVQDNYIVVYLEDRVTIYMDTDISLKDLPEELQQEIIQVMYIPDEESLYDFLENYSS